MLMVFKERHGFCYYDVDEFEKDTVLQMQEVTKLIAVKKDDTLYYDKKYFDVVRNYVGEYKHTKALEEWDK